MGKPYEIMSKADWSATCDPLKEEKQLGSLQYVETEGWKNITTDELVTTGTSSNWTCPVEERNPSGCGEFRTDTRNIVCSEEKSVMACDRPNNADNAMIRVAELPTLFIPQRHVCIQHPIFCDNVLDEAGRNPTLRAVQP